MKRGGRHDLSGGVIIWKPVGITSRAALEQAERRLGIGPLGHTGTLDPLASGILVLVGGQARRFQDHLVSQRKEYIGRIRLGICSDSEDAEGPLWCPLPRVSTPDRERVEKALDRFRGGYDQTPPRFSAVHIRGERAHRLARRGEGETPPARRVEIDDLEIVEWSPPDVELRVLCGPGTYLRSLARDLGEDLGTGGHLSDLRRTSSGGFGEDQSTALEEVSRDRWLSPEELLGHLPRLDLDPRREKNLSHGQVQPIPREGLDELPAVEGVRVAWCEERIVGLVEVRGSSLYPRRWLARTSR